MTVMPVVGISSVGSGVGESVVRSLRLSGLPVRIAGYGDPYAHSAPDCDTFTIVPPVHDDGYVEALMDAAVRDHVALLIPGLDDDVVIVAEQADAFAAEGVVPLVSDVRLVAACRDKGRIDALEDALSETGRLTAMTSSPMAARDLVTQGLLHLPMVAKPRRGRGSLGVRVITTVEELDELILEARRASARDSDMVVQELLLPAQGTPARGAILADAHKGRLRQVEEISIQLIADRSGEPMAWMATCNTLRNGTPVVARPFEDPSVDAAAERLMAHLPSLGWRGPMNVQGRITDDGFRAFEANPRFTGITASRALLGWNEVALCVTDALGLPMPALRTNMSRQVLRQVGDRAVVATDRPRATMGPPASSRRRILLTGASGFVGQVLLRELVLRDDLDVVASVHTHRPHPLPPRVGVVDQEVLLMGGAGLGGFDAVIHAAFEPSRSSTGPANSLVLTRRLANAVAAHDVPLLINLSSQSVYDVESPIPRSETSPLDPATRYGTAKLAAEQLIIAACISPRITQGVSLRLATLSGRGVDQMESEVLTRLARRASEGLNLELVDVDRRLERLHVRDAADAIITVLYQDISNWPDAVNIGMCCAADGPNPVDARLTDVPTLAMWGEMIVAAVSARRGAPPVEIVETMSTEPQRDSHVMDSSLFVGLTGWRPKVLPDELVRDVVAGVTS